MEGGRGEGGASGGPPVGVWAERSCLGVLLAVLGQVHGRFMTLVAGLKLHLSVMLLIFETDMPFHLLILKKPKGKQ